MNNCAICNRPQRAAVHHPEHPVNRSYEAVHYYQPAKNWPAIWLGVLVLAIILAVLL